MKTILLILLFFCHALEAHEILDDYRRFQEAIYDDPKGLSLETAKRLEGLNPDAQPAAWTIAFVAHLQAFGAGDGDIGTLPNLSENLDKAMMLAPTYGLHVQLIRLMDIRIDRLRQSAHPPSDAEIVALYEEAFRWADQHGILREKGLVMAYYSNYLIEMGRGIEAIKTLNDALKVMQSDPRVTELDMAIVRGYMAVSMWYLGDYEKFLWHMEQVDAYCKKSQLRSFCSTQLYNLGLHFVENQSRQDFDRAENLFYRSIELAVGIDDQHDVALCRYGLGTLYLRQKRWVEAERSLDQARVMFESFEDRVYGVKNLVNLAQAVLGQGKYPETLQILQNARRSLRPEMRRDLNRIEELTWQAYRLSGRNDEALVALEIYMESFKKISQDLQKQEYSKAVAAMGLQIEEEKNKALQAENNGKIRDLQRIRMAASILLLMLLLVALSMFIAIHRGRQVRAAKEKMQLILDTIDEGILSVDIDLTIIDEHSPFIQQLFPDQKLARAQVIEAILKPSTLNPEEIAMAEQALRACLGEDIIAWEFNSTHLPKELSYPNGRSIVLHWMPINDHGSIRKLLLAIRDITAQRRLQEKLQEEQERLGRLQRKIQEILSGRIQEIRHFLRRLEQQLPDLQASLQASHDLRPTLRTLHTMKGEARSLGLRDLSRRIHEWEDACRGGVSPTLFQAMEQVQKDWREYQYLVSQVLVVTSQEKDADQLLDVIAPLASLLRRQGQDAGLGFAGIEVLDGVEDWTTDALAAARAVLIHGLTNAMDHGYLLPLKNQQRPRKPWFQVEAVETDSMIRLTIRDHGVGLNMEKLRDLARDHGFQPKGDETLVDILFQDGLTTADSITESSGRGVGLSAVRALCREMGGDARLNSNDRGPGAMLLLEYRKESVVLRKPA